MNKGWRRRGESSRHRDIFPTSFAKLISRQDRGAGLHVHRRIDIDRPVSYSGDRVRIARRLVCGGESRRVSGRFDIRREQSSRMRCTRRRQRRRITGRIRRRLRRCLQDALNEWNRGHPDRGDSRCGGRFFYSHSIQWSRFLRPTAFRQSGIERSSTELLIG